MLAPNTWSRAERARRQELLERRRNLLQLNLPEEEIPDELSLSQIRCGLTDLCRLICVGIQYGIILVSSIHPNCVSIAPRHHLYAPQ